MQPDPGEDGSRLERSLAGLQAELRAGLKSVLASVSNLSDGVRHEQQLHRQALGEVLLAVGAGPRNEPRQPFGTPHSDVLRSSGVLSTERGSSMSCPFSVEPAVREGRDGDGVDDASEGIPIPSPASEEYQLDEDRSDQGQNGCSGEIRMEVDPWVERQATKSFREWRRGAHGSSGSHSWLIESMPVNLEVNMVGFERWRYRARRFLHIHGMWLDMAIGVAILVNSICIGIEIQNNLDNEEAPWLRTLESLFLVVFFLELCFRVFADNGTFVRSGWFMLDVSLVTIGMLTTWVITPILSSGSSGRSSLKAMDQILVLRIFRLLRLAWAVRMLEFFQEVWKLCSGLIKSAKTVVIACVLIFMVTYIFACLGVEAIRSSTSLNQNPHTREIIEYRFGSLSATMLTLLSFTNGDSLANVYEPIIKENPLFAVFFALVWLAVTVSLMNLVTAVIVDTAIRETKVDDEHKLLELRKLAKKLIPTIECLFDSLDTDGTGTLERSELSLATVDIPPDLQNVINGDEEKLMDLFSFLDVDNSNTVDKSEFVDGIMHLILQRVPIETTQTLQVLRSNKELVADVHSDLRKVHADLKSLHRDFRDLHRDFKGISGALCGGGPDGRLCDHSGADEVADEGLCACPASR